MTLHATIDTRKLAEMRYPTLGDYYVRDGIRVFEVADLGNEDYEFLIAIHEQIEEYLTRKHGIPEPTIEKFDRMFEAERASGKWRDEEPGNDPRAPYRPEHQDSELVEKVVARLLGVDWDAYERFCASL